MPPAYAAHFVPVHPIVRAFLASGKAGQVLIGIISLPEPGGRSLAIMAAFQFFVAAAEWKIMLDPAGSAIHGVIGLMLAVAWTKRHGAPTAGVNCERSKSS